MEAKKSWTKSQQNAISCRGGTVLVSAAAGSGKTAVLVQRVIEILTDKANPVDANSILVVTFSNAAAAEMKQRISQRLTELVSENPGDAYLLRQKTLISAAHISTVHAFCMNVVRSNFQLLDLPPDFRLGGEREIGLLEDDIAQEIVEQYYEKNDGRFSNLVELVSSGRDDSALINTLKTLYRFIRSHPFYNSWLDSKLLLYDNVSSVEESVWGSVILEYARNAITYAISLTRRAVLEIREDNAIAKAYLSAYEGDLTQLEQVAYQIQTGSWDDVCRALENIRFQRLSALRNYEDSAKKERLQGFRKTVQELIKALNAKQFCSNGAEFLEDIEFLEPIITTLFELAKAYDQRLSEEKKKHHLVDFADLEHFAVELLMENDGGSFVKTQLAQEYTEAFSTILVDEFQDTNETQDMLFRSVSRDDNLFLVGDVKQSIYRFRQAMPEIFIRKRNSYRHFDGENYPAKIILSNNFRSRAEVTDCINYLFCAIMSTEVGEIDYDEDESLVASAVYPEKHDAVTEVHFIENTNEENSDALAEALYTAQRISQLLESGFTVTEAGEERAILPRDICILLRSPKNKAELYSKALDQRGIAVWTDSHSGFLQTVEVSTALSLLRAVDNPLIDVHLTAAMMSAIFAFTPDEMALIRLHNREAHLYLNCIEIIETPDHSCCAHCLSFVEQVQQLRVLGATCPAHQLLQKMMDLTGLWDLVSAMKCGELRKANLRLLIDYARDYERGGQKGIAGFLRFLDRLTERGDDLSCACSISDEADAVRIMSIHRSKGLEFPVVFICDTAKRFNVQDLRANMLLHSELGFACNVRDFVTRAQYTTVPMEALRLELERSMLSEEMRILYVAMTRAKEKLIVTSVQNSLPKKLSAFSEGLAGRGTVSPYIVREGASFADWLLMSLIHHPDAAALCATNDCEVEDLVVNPVSHFELITAAYGNQAAAAVGEALTFESLPDEEALLLLGNKLSQSYSDPDAPTLPSKLSVSQIVSPKQIMGFQKEPAFLKSRELTGAQKGTALHAYMTYANHAVAVNSLEEEISRMVEKRFLTYAEGDSLNRESIKQYYLSPLHARVCSSPWVEREFAFMMDMGSDSLAAVLPNIGGHKITVQGIADLLFEEAGELVLVDFKTDHGVVAGELAQRYKPQLSLYAKMIQATTGKRIKEMIIYSLSLGAEVRVES